MGPVEIPIEAIYRAVRFRITNPGLREDVAQQACLIALERPASRSNIRTLLIDGMRAVWGRERIRNMGLRRPLPLDNPEWLASLYPTETQLVERWNDEETEDQVIEWRRLPAAERDQLVSEAGRGLGTSCG